MKYLCDASWTNVHQDYERDHGNRPDAAWERMIISRANKYFGKWARVSLDHAELCQIILPEHQHGAFSKRQGELVMATPNMSIEEALNTFGDDLDMMNLVNSHCYSAVLMQRELIRNKGLRTICLASRSFDIHGGESPTYRSKTAVLDGFHRLLAAASMPDKPRTIEAYIAFSERHPLQGRLEDSAQVQQV